jgi:hypothetical protein
VSSWSRAIYHSHHEQYYKYCETWKGPDILVADSESALEKGSREFHDHLFKRNGNWYSQVKIDGRHLFEELSPGVYGVTQEDSAEFLDVLLRELKRLG